MARCSWCCSQRPSGLPALPSSALHSCHCPATWKCPGPLPCHLEGRPSWPKASFLGAIALCAGRGGQGAGLRPSHMARSESTGRSPSGHGHRSCISRGQWPPLRRGLFPRLRRGCLPGPPTALFCPAWGWRFPAWLHACGGRSRLPGPASSSSLCPWTASSSSLCPKLRLGHRWELAPGWPGGAVGTSLGCRTPRHQARWAVGARPAVPSGHVIAGPRAFRT